MKDPIHHNQKKKKNARSTQQFTLNPSSSVLDYRMVSVKYKQINTLLIYISNSFSVFDLNETSILKSYLSYSN